MRFQELWQGFLGAAGGSIRYTVSEGEALFENVKRIVTLSEDRIVLMGKRGGVEVEGSMLSLGRSEGGDAVVVGKIARVTRL